MNPEIVVIYHASCADGFTAAWIIWQKAKENAEFIPMHYGQDPPDVTGKTVYVVDFSFKREVMLKMKEQADSIIVLDHHKTAEKELEGLDFCIFDQSKSGAMLTWDYINGNKSAPPLVKYVQDRDLWTWKLPYSKQISALIQSCEFGFLNWEVLNEEIHKNFNTVVSSGQAVLNYQNRVVDNLVKNAEVIENFMDTGYNVPVLNCTTLISEVGNKLCQGHPFSATFFTKNYSQMGDELSIKYIYSLRSAEDGVDVSEIAKQFGGGGHKHVAGFSL